jgi:hypothetical protein
LAADAVQRNYVRYLCLSACTPCWQFQILVLNPVLERSGNVKPVYQRRVVSVNTYGGCFSSYASSTIIGPALDRLSQKVNLLAPCVCCTLHANGFKQLLSGF